MKVSHTDRLGVWVYVARGDPLRPWISVRPSLVEGGLVGVCVGVMWGPRWRGNR